MASPTSESAHSLRRRFLRYLIRALGALWAGGFVAAAVSYLRIPRFARSLSSQAVEVGGEADLPPGQGRMITGDHPPFWIIRTAAGALVALSAVCTHRRCMLTWRGATATLDCPCHGGRFDLNGNVLSGPPPRPLPSFTVSVKGGRIYVYT